GVALVDYDNDGDLDVYLVQGHDLSQGGKAPAGSPSDRLLRNDLRVAADGSRSLRFVDVTAESGVAVTRGYGMGVAAGDFDNDGWTDLYLTNWGENQLLRNLGPGSDGAVRFEDITRAAGAEDPRWSVSASFADFDRDGWLDLYVANYVAFEIAVHKPCRSHTGAQDYCSPLAYSAVPDRLLRNRGDRGGGPRFARVESQSGVSGLAASGLGVASADFDDDGWVDFYVANDQTSNQLWINGRDGSFDDQALLGGVAVNADGRPEAGMGIAVGDIDGDGDPDVLVSHLDDETHTLYVNQGGGFFEDQTQSSGLAIPTWDKTGFGLAWIDFDNDGRLDMASANGAVTYLEALVRARDPFPLHQPNQLFRNLGGGRFQQVGGAFTHSEVSRGLAVGDLDNDGDPDLVITNNNGPARLLLNAVGAENSWLGLRVLETSGRDALGARVEARLPGGSLRRQVQSDGSYASAQDPRVLLGLGDAGAVEDLRVRWVDGAVESFGARKAGAYYELRRGEGSPVPSGPQSSSGR
ncbi:MAG: CRTAC1 family protein, partial [Acidobacteriota bacterium]